MGEEDGLPLALEPDVHQHYVGPHRLGDPHRIVRGGRGGADGVAEPLRPVGARQRRGSS